MDGRGLCVCVCRGCGTKQYMLGTFCIISRSISSSIFKRYMKFVVCGESERACAPLPWNNSLFQF